MPQHVHWLSTVILGLGLAACGAPHKHQDRRGNDGALPPDTNGEDTAVGIKDAVLRGQWRLPMGTPGSTFLRSATFLGATSNQSIGATVAANVSFTVSADHFSTPPAVDIASYGTLDVTNLRDNNLSVCGANGKQRCTKAMIRIYTSGTPGAGLWNTVEGYGVPILTDGHQIGLDAAGSYVITSIAVGTTKVLKLKNFTAAASLPIPISVDFGDAAAGSYQSTLVVEYLLQ